MKARPLDEMTPVGYFAIAAYLHTSDNVLNRHSEQNVKLKTLRQRVINTTTSDNLLKKGKDSEQTEEKRRYQRMASILFSTKHYMGTYPGLPGTRNTQNHRARHVSLFLPCTCLCRGGSLPTSGRVPQFRFRPHVCSVTGVGCGNGGAPSLQTDARGTGATAL